MNACKSGFCKSGFLPPTFAPSRGCQLPFSDFYRSVVLGQPLSTRKNQFLNVSMRQIRLAHGVSVAWLGSRLSLRSYGHLPNVLFETFNEPTWQSWSREVKPYHEEARRLLAGERPPRRILEGSSKAPRRLLEGSSKAEGCGFSILLALLAWIFRTSAIFGFKRPMVVCGWAGRFQRGLGGIKNGLDSVLFDLPSWWRQTSVLGLGEKRKLTF